MSAEFSPASPTGVATAEPHDFIRRHGLAGEYPFASHFLDLGGVNLHYVDQGTGPVLLMVHGNPTWSFAWRALIADLSQDHRVIAVDHVGCGLSDKPQNYAYTLAQHVQNLKRLVTTLALNDVTLFGHDWGGCIGMGAAGDLPERFRRFVLMNTAAFRSTRIPLRIAVCRIPLLGTIGVRGFNLFSQAALSMAMAHPDRLTALVRKGYLAPYDGWGNRIAVHRFVQDIPLKASHPSYSALVHVEDSLAQFVDHPMLLVWGEQDWCFTPEFLAEWQRRFPRAESLRLRDAGHYLFEDAPERIISRVREFLEQTPSATS